jgi:hypothetical protein
VGVLVFHVPAWDEADYAARGAFVGSQKAEMGYRISDMDLFGVISTGFDSIGKT